MQWDIYEYSISLPDLDSASRVVNATRDVNATRNASPAIFGQLGMESYIPQSLS